MVRDSDNQWSLQVFRLPCSQMLNPPPGIEIVYAQTIFCEIGFLHQPVAQKSPLNRPEPAFKNRFLNALAKILASAGNPAQATFAFRRGGGDIVRNEQEHLPSILQYAWHIAGQITA